MGSRLMNHWVRWRRLAVSALGALVLGVVGFAEFVRNIHDPTPFDKAVETIGLPFFELGARIGVFWIAIAAGVILWTAVLYAVISAFVLVSGRGRS